MKRNDQHINSENLHLIKLLPARKAALQLNDVKTSKNEVKKNSPVFYTKPIHKAKKFDLL